MIAAVCFMLGALSGFSLCEDVAIYKSYEKNPCEIGDGQTCCLMVMSSSAMYQANSGHLPKHPKAVQAKISVLDRFYCPDLTDNSKCELKPQITVSFNVSSAAKEFQGLEISVMDNNSLSKYQYGEQVFIQIGLDFADLKAQDFPDIVIDSVPLFNFKPGHKYNMSLSTLPKVDMSSWKDSHDYKAAVLPSLEGVGNDAPEWLEVPLFCNEFDTNEYPEFYCNRSEACHLPCDSLYARAVRGRDSDLARSLVVALSISGVFLLFFVLIVIIARRNTPRIYDDQEMLYEDDDDYYEDDLSGSPMRQTELKDLSTTASGGTGSGTPSHDPTVAPHGENVINSNGDTGHVMVSPSRSLVDEPIDQSNIDL